MHIREKGGKLENKKIIELAYPIFGESVYHPYLRSGNQTWMAGKSSNSMEHFMAKSLIYMVDFPACHVSLKGVDSMGFKLTQTP